MKQKRVWLIIFAWIQLVISMLLVASIVWGYMTYQSSIGQIIKSMAASIHAVSNVVIRTAESVESRRATIDEMQKMLVKSRMLIYQLKINTENLSKVSPSIIASAKAAASQINQNVDKMQEITATAKEISVPNIKFEGGKPTILLTKPFKELSLKIEKSGQEMKELAAISEKIGRDARNMGSSFLETSEQAIKVIDEVDKSLVRLKENDLPKAIEDLRVTSKNMHNISTTLDTLANVDLIIFIIGLLLAFWYMAQSIWTLSHSKLHALE